MKKYLIAFLMAALLLMSAAYAEELSETVMILSVWADEDYSAYENAKKTYNYTISEWTTSSNRSLIRVEAPQKVSGDFAYAMLPDGTAVITKVLADRKIIEIPSEIDGVTVTQIGMRTSSDRGDNINVAAVHPMEKLIIPDTVTYIGTYSFFRMNDLKEIVLPDTLEHLGNNCIVDSKAKTTSLPSSLKYIGEQMSWGLGLEMKKLELPKGLEGIGPWAFSMKNWQQVILPGSLKTIDQEAFKECRKLTTLTMEEGLTKLGHSMFKGCTALTKLTFPASMQEISEFAFDGCKKIASVKFAEGSQLQKVAQGAFSNCIALKSIVLPEGTQEIAGEAFYGCKALSSITIPASVTAIGDYAFEGCSSKLVLTVAEGSYAESWAQENGIKTKHPAKKK